jgi:hypothetical protein
MRSNLDWGTIEQGRILRSAYMNPRFDKRERLSLIAAAVPSSGEEELAFCQIPGNQSFPECICAANPNTVGCEQPPNG